MGLEILFPKPGSAQPDPLTVDIVAVHGLNGDPANTWKHPANNHFWLQDSLPLDVKGARVLNYGYNADVVFGNSTADIWDHAKGLLGSLIDERETDDELRRPIIFIAHSLGGIIVKQALVWAHREPRYRTIKDYTLGVVFFGTPHRGSDKANYGKILANVATGVMHKPKSKLINALESNSEVLMRLTSEFKFDAPNMEIMTFYETKRMGPFSGLIVEKHSALLELSHEDIQPVDANHRDMCKFDTRNHETYKKLVKRVNRILKEKDISLFAPELSTPKSRNKYSELPFNVSAYFTGGDDVLRELREKCLPLRDSLAQNQQNRFILYGLGGSGKTQMALKFALDHQERYWGIFFIDTSSADMADKGFSTMARTCKVGERMEDFKRYLTNSPEPWLLILDNADDPRLDISRFFPVGKRGTIIVTSRNPECRCHATVGSRELREMESDEAVDLLLRSGDLSSEDRNLRDLALPIVQTLGHLALAVNHAGASIRQKICSLEDYLSIFIHQRKKLLSSKPVQAELEYEYTVYTTWEISVARIKELAKNAKDGTAVNALELLKFFGFCHFDDITEDIFRSAWGNGECTDDYPWWASNLLDMIRDRRLSNWDFSLLFNEAIHLLSNYSLIHVSGPNNRISLHPLVHSWIRDSLSEDMHLRWWNITISTLALVNRDWSVYRQRQLKAHLRHCISTRQIDDILQEDEVALDRVEILSKIIEVYLCHPWKDGLTLSKRAFEYSRRVLGDECYSTCMISFQLAIVLNNLSRYQNTSDLLRGQLDITIRVAGPANALTVKMMSQLTWAYRSSGRKQAALELAQKNLAICEELLDERDWVYLNAFEVLAVTYSDLGRHEESISMYEKLLAKRKEIFHEEDERVLSAEYGLACTYGNSGQHQVALDIFLRYLKKYSSSFGEDHPATLRTMANTAIEYGQIGHSEKGMPLLIKALDVGSRIDLDIKWLQGWKEQLERLESRSANPPTAAPTTPSESQGPPHSERVRIPNRKVWRLMRKIQGRRGRSPSRGMLTRQSRVID